MIHANTSAIAAELSASRPMRGLRHAAILEDARHDRERGDRHRRGHEQRERPERRPPPARADAATARSPGPRAIGSSTLSTPTRPAALTCARTPSGARSSAPTMNMNSTSPSVDSDDSAGSESFANSCAWNSGNSAPNTIGPSTMPAAISPITARLAEVLQQQSARARGGEDDHELQQQERMAHGASASAGWAMSAVVAMRAYHASSSQRHRRAIVAERGEQRVEAVVVDVRMRARALRRGSPPPASACARRWRAMRASNAASSSVSFNARFISWNQSMPHWLRKRRSGASGRVVALAPFAQQRLHREVQRAALRELRRASGRAARCRSAACAKNSGASSAQ